MSIFEIIILSISLASDAFFVSITNGMNTKSKLLYYSFMNSIYFGLFQFIMPIIGYYLGKIFYDYLIYYDHWISFILLLIIGINMIKENDDDYSFDYSFKNMIILSIATSIDALAIGFSFSLLNVSLYFSCIVIGIITFIMCMIGTLIGNKFTIKNTNITKYISASILIIIGLKILLTHLFC